MSNPNRLKVYYAYRCFLCGEVQHRGSSARRCNVKSPTFGKCEGPLIRIKGAKCRTRPPRISL